MNILSLIEEIRKRNDCIVYPKTEEINILKKHKLPDDLRDFYELCSGLTLFSGDDKHTFHIVSPKEFTLANPVIIGELCEDDITSDWYIVAKNDNGGYITIDLNEKRNSRCYDSFWDRHGIAGECPIISTSFSELLLKLVENEGDYLYWEKDTFKIIGDAYDDI